MHAASLRQVQAFILALAAYVAVGFVYPPRPGQGRGFARWIDEDLGPREVVALLREAARANAAGAAVYLRVREGVNGHPGVIMIDDVKRAAIDRMIKDGWEATAIIETSPENFQVWIRLVTVGECIDRQAAKAVIDHLIARYGGDPRACSPVQPGRMPGYVNGKEKHRRTDGKFPFVRLRAARVGHVAPAASEFLAVFGEYEKSQRAGAPGAAPETRPAAAGVTGSFDADFETLDGFRAEEAARIADEAMLGRRPAEAASASEVDFATCRRALITGLDPEYVQTWLASRRPDKGASYPERTVRAAIEALASSNLRRTF